TRNQPVPGKLYAYSNKVDKQTRIAVNGTTVSASPDALGYVSLQRTWHSGDVIEVEFPMEVRQVVADSRVREDKGRLAVERGPIVYCAEWPDTTGGHAIDVLVDSSIAMAPSSDESLFGGATVIKTQSRRVSSAATAAQPLTLIPYHLWANRGTGEM